jgi:hypothetical protein
MASFSRFSDGLRGSVPCDRHKGRMRRAVRNLLNGLQSLGDRGAKLPRRLGNAYVVAGTHGRGSVVAKQQLAEEI